MFYVFHVPFLQPIPLCIIETVFQMPALFNQMIALTPEEIAAAKQNVFAAVRMVEKRTGARFESARDTVLEVASEALGCRARLELA